jgi:hypothetical protein
MNYPRGSTFISVLILLVCITVGILLVFLHLMLYEWIISTVRELNPNNPLKIIWRMAFSAIILVICDGTIGLAALMAYRKRH